VSAQRVDAVVVGAGLAGLAAARHLRAGGLEVLVLEAEDTVGGRIRTDVVDGFLLDRGFQVLNTAYPELRRQVDLEGLHLRRFTKGALLHLDGGRHRVEDPRRSPSHALESVRVPTGDAVATARLTLMTTRDAYGPLARLLHQDDVDTATALATRGISRRAVDAVLRPFFAGVFLEDQLTTSVRFFDLMMRMFVRGDSTLPTFGMQALPDQLAALLPPDSVRLQTAVTAVEPTGVRTPDGRIEARAVVVATDAVAARDLVPRVRDVPWNGVTTLYHAAREDPLGEPTLLLDCDGDLVCSTTVLSAVSRSYAPSGSHLVSTSVLGGDRGDLAGLERAVRARLAELYGTSTSAWTHLATYALPHALPAMPAPHPMRRPVRTGGVYVCGDHQDTSSIQGALVSGRRAAEAVLADLA
jgi:phytoene dehydrogenase-like protein